MQLKHLLQKYQLPKANLNKRIFTVFSNDTKAANKFPQGRNSPILSAPS